MNTRSGFSLVEVMVAGILLSIGFFGLMMVNRSSNQLTLDSYHEFLAIQLAQEPVEVFRSVGYPECTNLLNYKIGSEEVILIDDPRYPPEASRFRREIKLDTSNLPMCLVSVRVTFDSSAGSWLRPGKEAIVMEGIIPIVR